MTVKIDRVFKCGWCHSKVRSAQMPEGWLSGSDRTPGDNKDEYCCMRHYTNARDLWEEAQGVGATSAWDHFDSHRPDPPQEPEAELSEGTELLQLLKELVEDPPEKLSSLEARVLRIASFALLEKGDQWTEYQPEKSCYLSLLSLADNCEAK